MISFSDAEKSAIVLKIKRYFMAELDQEIGQFDAEFLLDFFAKEFGAAFYNRGLSDAQQVIQSRVDLISEAISELEEPVDL